MLEIRRAEARGLAELGWLHSRHTFSFGHYYDPKFMGFGPLRVINEDRVQPSGGFDTHGHSDMEIISYVLGGALAHKDSMGNGSVIRPGDVQRMSAGKGVRHSEFNASATEPVHFLQIWVLPEKEGLEPGYEQKNFPEQDKRGRLRLVGSRNGHDGSVTIHSDVNMYSAMLQENDRVEHELAKGRKAWIHVARGETEVNGESLRAADGASIEGPALLSLAGTPDDAEVLLFDMG